MDTGETRRLGRGMSCLLVLLFATFAAAVPMAGAASAASAPVGRETTVACAAPWVLSSYDDDVVTARSASGSAGGPTLRVVRQLPM